jgi:hypothetical protein
LEEKLEKEKSGQEKIKDRPVDEESKYKKAKKE